MRTQFKQQLTCYSLALLAGLPLSLNASTQQTNQETRDQPDLVITGHSGQGDYSATELDQQQLDDHNLSVLSDIERLIPGLNMNNQGALRYNMATLRGIGDITRQDYFNSSIAVMVDGVYVPTAELDLALLNVERVEVLKGPQNARFGRNAIAGAINIVTRPVADSQNSVMLGAGNQSREEFRLAAAKQLTEQLAGRFSLQSERVDGFIHNLHDGDKLDDRENLTLNAGAELKLNDQWSTLLNYGYVDKTAGLSGNLPYENYHQRLTDLAGSNEETFKIHTGDLHLRYRGDNMDFTSITSVRDNDLTMHMDLGYTQAPGMPYPGPFPKGSHSKSAEEGKQFSQSFELKNKAADNDTQWLLGLQFTRAEQLYEYLIERMFEMETDYERQDYSAYGEVSWHLNPVWSLVTAARYTHEKHDATGTAYSVDGTTGATVIIPLQGKQNEHLFTPRVELAYEPDQNTTWFTSVSQGARGGGLNRIQMLESYDTEKVTTVELGLKKHWPEQELMLTTALFNNDMRDMQIKQYTYGGSSYSLTNAGKAHSYGIEAELSWMAQDNWQLFANGTLLKARFDDFDRGNGDDLSGNYLPNMPENNITIGTRWHKPLQNGLNVKLVADYAWKGKHYFDPENKLSDKYGLFNGQIGLEKNGWSLSLWGKNLLDKDYVTHAYKDDFGTKVASAGRGRELGIRLQADF